MYLLFISYNTGLMHNKSYNSFNEIYQSIDQLTVEENINETIISKADLSQMLNTEADFKYCFSNGTWFHVQQSNFS